MLQWISVLYSLHSYIIYVYIDAPEHTHIYVWTPQDETGHSLGEVISLCEMVDHGTNPTTLPYKNRLWRSVFQRQKSDI